MLPILITSCDDTSVDMQQIMDPKMDSGYLAEGESLNDDYDILRALVPEEVIGIMDQMMCFEVKSNLFT